MLADENSSTTRAYIMIWTITLISLGPFSSPSKKPTWSMQFTPNNSTQVYMGTNMAKLQAVR
jgi:hypothetical protein